MRHIRVNRTVKTDARRIREETDERPAGRPEVRKGIGPTWWPDG
ncbi:hypothetical protein [Streptomyces sp.]|nr:hypothetical protein [Streptomyces sp.]